MSELRIRPMTSAEFTEFRERSIKGYAAEHVRAGNWREEEAEELAAQETEKLLPDGLDTAGMLLFSAETPDRQVVGIVWVALDREGTGPWIYDIEISPDHRGRGYGRALLRLAEQEVEKRGHDAIALNVFGDNTVARRLYESSGYEVVTLQMRKPLRRDRA